MIESPLQAAYRRLLKPPPWRIWTAARRALPDFLIIGAMRGGTTTLHDLLARHPAVSPAIKKEVHFFDLYYLHGVRWYRSHFPDRTTLTRRDALTGEASPYYLSHPLAPRRARETVPEARLIAVLRNPVDRAYSHYWHSVRLGVEDLDFAAALEAEPNRLSGEADRLRREPGYASRAHQHQAYATRSRYADELSAWLAEFPADQLLVLGHEAFVQHPEGQFRRLCAFLDLPSAPALPTIRRNRQDYPPMDPGLRRRLLESFKPHNERLFDLIGERHDWDD